MTGSQQIALVFQGGAVRPRRSILRAIRRFERWEAEGWLFYRRHLLRADVQALLVETGGDKSKALEAWRRKNYEEWALVFDFADTLGLRMTKSQRDLRLLVNIRLSAKIESSEPAPADRHAVAEWPGWLHLDGWAGATKQAVIVVGETPKRYRIRGVGSESVRLTGRRRISQAETALVPKHAVTRRDGPS